LTLPQQARSITTHSLTLQECLAAKDQENFRLVWRCTPSTKPLAAPKLVLSAVAVNATDADAEADGAASQVTLSNSSSSDAAGAGVAGSLSMSLDDDLETRRAKLAAVVQASKEGGWPLFMHNMLTFLWKTIYGKSLPPEVAIPLAKVKKLMPHLGPEELAAVSTVRHTFAALA
jgi:hypothetical protein